ncbi:MAG: hypothetical protein A4E28_02037 [Methanocella sp. PtaU1.Bin125]|nr:MAG: hypothetical protein A4E28_02037 [Methanocella sp. PtaU1.Bin125]
MDTDEVLEWHDRYIGFYRTYFLTFEFIVFPAVAILAGYWLGYLDPASAIVVSYFVADITTTIVSGRTLMGVKIPRIKPWKLHYARPLMAVLSVLLILILAAVAILELISGKLLIGLASLCLVAIYINALIMQWKKMYDRRLAAAFGFLLLIMMLLIAAYVEHPIIKIITLLLALAWSVFVALGTYNVFIKRQQAQS